MAAQDPADENGNSQSDIPHVLHVADANCFARFGRMFRQFGLALSDEGVRVSLLTDDAEAAAALDGTPIANHCFAALRGWGVWRLYGYLRRAFEPPPTIIHLWGTSSLAHLSDFSTTCGAALLIHMTSDADLAAIEKRGLRSNEWLACMTSAYADHLRERLPQSGDRVEVVPPALLLPERVADLQVRERTLGILWAGRIRHCEGLDVLIDAVARLRDKNCDLQVAITGQAVNTPPVWRAIRRRNVADRVSLIAEPWLWDQAMAGVDICVVPQREAELYLAPLLAMSLGKVVIASRDQAADWFVENRTSLHFTPGSAVELAYHIMRTADVYPNVLATARAAAKYVSENHAVSNVASRMATLYRALISRKAVVASSPVPHAR